MNDVYDYESDLRNPRKQGQSLEGGILSPVYHNLVLISARAASLLILLSSLIPPLSSNAPVSPSRTLQGPLITVALLVLSWQYSSPPLRLKERPLLDSLSNGVVVWLCWARGYTAEGLPLFGSGAMESAAKGWVLAFCTAGVHALGAAADVDADNAAGQRTIATVFGQRTAALFSTAA